MYKTLILEDDPLQRKILVKSLEKLGITEPKEAADGHHALSLLKELEPNIIFCDLKMPGMDGVEFIRRASDLGINSSLVITSGLEGSLQSSIENMAKSYGFKVLGRLEKPIKPQELENVIGLYDDKSLPPSYQAFEIYSLDRVLDAIDQGEIYPYYQPKVCFKTNDWVGAEALARWVSPEQGLISPAAFIPVLEKEGKTELLLVTILEHSISQCRKWLDMDKSISVSVNFSAKDLVDLSITERVMGLLCWKKVPPELLTIEVTESAVVDDLGKVVENLARLRMHGVNISIDDFGTGFSSMEQLSKLPFNELKIDMSFVRDCNTNKQHRAIVESNLQLAKRLGMKTVAEGVEARAHWDILKELSADVCQGFYTARPMEGDDCITWYLERLT